MQESFPTSANVEQSMSSPFNIKPTAALYLSWEPAAYASQPMDGLCLLRTTPPSGPPVAYHKQHIVVRHPRLTGRQRPTTILNIAMRRITWRAAVVADYPLNPLDVSWSNAVPGGELGCLGLHRRWCASVPRSVYVRVYVFYLYINNLSGTLTLCLDGFPPSSSASSPLPNSLNIVQLPANRSRRGRFEQQRRSSPFSCVRVPFRVCPSD